MTGGWAMIPVLAVIYRYRYEHDKATMDKQPNNKHQIQLYRFCGMHALPDPETRDSRDRQSRYIVASTA